MLSLIAEVNSQIVAHMLFSRMWIDTQEESIPAVALAPMAVLPSYQRRGIGSALIHTGLEQLRERGQRIVMVLGHEHYYPRFGFSSEKARSLVSPFPPESFLALELSPGALTSVEGTVRYPDAVGL